MIKDKIDSDAESRGSEQEAARKSSASPPDTGLHKPTPVVKNFRRFIGLWANTTAYR